MPRSPLRFRISVTDVRDRCRLVVELIEPPYPGGRRYWRRVNGRNAVRVPEASLTTVLHRLRAWLVRRA